MAQTFSTILKLAVLIPGKIELCNLPVMNRYDGTIGRPYNILVTLNDDTLPSPDADGDEDNAAKCRGGKTEN